MEEPTHNDDSNASLEYPRLPLPMDSLEEVSSTVNIITLEWRVTKTLGNKDKKKNKCENDNNPTSYLIMPDHGRSMKNSLNNVQIVVAIKICFENQP